MPQRTVITRVVVALFLSFLLAACGRSDAVEQAARVSSAARDASAEALARVADLEATVSRLEIVADRHRADAERLGRVLDRVEANGRRQTARSKALARAVGRLKESLHAVSARASGAGRRAGKASAAADALERALSVLTKRFDYHLKHSTR